MAFNQVGTQILNHLNGDFIKLGASYVNPFVYSDRIPKISVVQMSLMCTRHYTASPWSNVSPVRMNNWRFFVGGGVPTCRSRYAYFVATQSRTCVVAYRCIDCANTCISNDMSSGDQRALRTNSIPNYNREIIDPSDSARNGPQQPVTGHSISRAL